MPLPNDRHLSFNIKLLAVSGGKRERFICDIFVVLVLTAYKNGDFWAGSFVSHTHSRNIGYWMVDTRYWILDSGCWILDAGYWMLDTGS